MQVLSQLRQERVAVWATSQNSSSSRVGGRREEGRRRKGSKREGEGRRPQEGQTIAIGLGVSGDHGENKS